MRNHSLLAVVFVLAIAAGACSSSGGSHSGATTTGVKTTAGSHAACAKLKAYLAMHTPATLASYRAAIPAAHDATFRSSALLLANWYHTPDVAAKPIPQDVTTGWMRVDAACRSAGVSLQIKPKTPTTIPCASRDIDGMCQSFHSPVEGSAG